MTRPLSSQHPDFPCESESNARFIGIEKLTSVESDEAFQSPDEKALLFSTNLMPDVSKITFMLTLRADLAQVHQN
jgi:hypothetical protein